MKDWAAFNISENETDKLIYSKTTTTTRKPEKESEEETEKEWEKATRKSSTWYTNTWEKRRELLEDNIQNFTVCPIWERVRSYVQIYNNEEKKTVSRRKENVSNVFVR